MPTPCTRYERFRDGGESQGRGGAQREARGGGGNSRERGGGGSGGDDGGRSEEDRVKLLEEARKAASHVFG